MQPSSTIGRFTQLANSRASQHRPFQEISGRGLPLKEAEGQRSGVESYVDVHGKRPELLEKSLQGQQRSSDG
ncbi:hypothetical protein Y032_0059g3002 [Ancylostoma ceylanicum]|uniref:Uncharacterized protein n=1 Tax=Ancylostoma ceylanicum TaxID=53326 RepID=A0A016U3I8_9BILA|nr:hypothetical protein Y032_0059g3002 [Ancylostoma ceylanicum]